MQLRKITRIPALVLATSLTVASLTGCGGGSGNATPPVSFKASGTWSAPAYGIAANITDTSYSFYQFNSGYCQKYQLGEIIDMDFNAFIESTEVSEDGNSLETTLGQLKVPGIVMQKQDKLPQHCIDNLIPSEGEPNYSFNPFVEFEIFWQTFNEQYAFFALEENDWEEVYQVARDAITANMNKEELFGLFAEMITPLRDFHVEIVSPDLRLEYSSPSRKPDYDLIAFMDFLAINDYQTPLNEEQYIQFMEYSDVQIETVFNIILNEVATGESVYKNDTETITWGRLNNNIGYVNLDTMDYEEISGSNSITEGMQILETTMDKVLTDLAGVQGLVVDVRFNSGGDDFVSQYIASRFTKLRFKAYSKQARLGFERTPAQHVVIEPKGNNQFDGPITILTSMSTSSAAEVFALTMRERTNTILIGEASAGGLSDQAIKVLPSGISYTLSNEIYISADGEAFEGSGVPVEIERPFFTLEQRESGVDLGLQAATDWLFAH